MGLHCSKVTDPRDAGLAQPMLLSVPVATTVASLLLMPIRSVTPVSWFRDALRWMMGDTMLARAASTIVCIGVRAFMYSKLGV